MSHKDRDSKGRFVKGRKIKILWKDKISKSLKGHKVTKETREKIRQKLKGKSYLTNEGRKKISNANKGRKLSKKTRENMSKAQRQVFYDGKRTHKGWKNPAWKGGIWNHSSGYVYIWKPELSWANGKGYIKRANWIWFKKTGEIIKFPFILHHKNENKTDDRLNNLIKITRKEHINLHRLKLNKFKQIKYNTNSR